MAEDWIVRSIVVDPSGRKKRYLTKWQADCERTWRSSCWCTQQRHATRWDEKGAKFAATIAGGKAVRVVKRATPNRREEP